MFTPKLPIFSGLAERPSPWRSFAAASFASAALHALLAGALALSTVRGAQPPKEFHNELILELFDPIPAAARGEINGAAIAANVLQHAEATPPSRPRLKPRARKAPAPPDPSPSSAADASGRALEISAASAAAARDAAREPASPQAEPGSSLQPIAAKSTRTASLDSRAGTSATAGPANTSVLAFMDGMTRPRLVSKVDPEYTREARDANVQGVVLAKCVITTFGTLERCRILKGIAAMDRAVLSALASWRYTPVLYRGKPTAVEYVIPIRLTLP